MEIGKKDILWNYLSTFLKIANSAILFPIILKELSSELVGFWTVFMSIYSFVVLMDFGFSPSFTRNVTYVFSGVQSLQKHGYEEMEEANPVVNYSLLKGLINSMQFFYRRIAFIALAMLLTFGTYYIHTLLKGYNGNHTEIYVSWVLLSVVTSYNLYTLYYDSLIQGKGLIKRDKQINIVGQIFNLSFSIVLILLGSGILSVVIGQLVSVIVVRYLSYRTFYTKELREELKRVEVTSFKEIFNMIKPNAIKIGLTSLGGILVTKSALIIGSLYLSLDQIASYGITLQLISVIMGLSTIYFNTHQPQIVNYRVMQNTSGIFSIYKKSLLFMVATYIIGGLGLYFIGPYVLEFIGSKTQLLSGGLIVLALVASLLEVNVGVAGTILLTKNYVPFFKASLISGFSILFLLLLFSVFKHINLTTMILIPLFVNICYQAWKWPYEAYIDLKS